MSRTVGWGLTFGVCLFICCGCAGLGGPTSILIVPGKIVAELLFGWMIFLVRTLIETNWNLSGLRTLVGCSLVFAAGLHILLARFFNQIRRSNELRRIPQFWKWQWTVAVVFMVMLFYVAGLAADGLIADTVWLVTARERIVGNSQAADRIRSTVNLKWMGLALQNRHDQTEHFPPGAIFDLTGRPLHGWQTLLLPFIEQEKLFASIDMNRPWNDPVNAEHFRTQIKMYQYNYRKPPLVDNAGFGLTHYAGNIRVLGGDEPRSLVPIFNGIGTANIVLVGEVKSNFVPWGYPLNWRDPALGINKSPAGFGNPVSVAAPFLFADGSVRNLHEGIDAKVLRAMSDPNGGAENERVLKDYYREAK